MGSSMSERSRIVVGISGASGAIYAQTLVRFLVREDYEVHLVITKCGKRLLHDELGVEGDEFVSELGDGGEGVLVVHPVNDIGASIASGSFQHGGMVVVPCSSHSLAMMANGLGDNLLTRAAAVTLKEKRRLVIGHRESPLTLIDIENMRRLALAGAVIAPANPGWYMAPGCLQDIANFVASRLLDALGVVNDLVGRWGGDNG